MFFKKSSNDCFRTPLDTYYENYFTSTTEENRMTSLLPIFEKFDVCDHWNLSHLHLIVLGCSPLDLSTYLTITSETIDVIDSFGRTALMWAAWRGDHTSFSTLLQHGANPHATSFDGNSVLIYATYGGSLECIGLVLGVGADINYMSHSLVTPVMVRPRISDNIAIATVRVVRGAQIEASRRQRFTPLYVAALTNQVESLAYLLDAGATTDVSSWDCSTPITVAIALNNHLVIQELINRDSDPNAVSDFKFSRLKSLAMYGDERTMRLFIDARPAINIHLKDAQGRTAQDYLWERLHSTGPMNPEKERLAKVFQQLVDVCSEAYEKAQGESWQVREVDEDLEGHSDVFQDALEDYH